MSVSLVEIQHCEVHLYKKLISFSPCLVKTAEEMKTLFIFELTIRLTLDWSLTVMQKTTETFLRC